MLKKINNSAIIDIIKQRSWLFDSFLKVYLFGSVLDLSKKPNDIDLLLIYSNISNNILEKANIIKEELEKLCGFSIDLTVLSISEEKEIRFLEKINYKCLKIK